MYTFVVKEVIQSFLSLIHCDAQPLLMFSSVGVFKTLETKG